MTGGRVGRPHGRDGSFWVEGATEELAGAAEVTVRGSRHAVERRSGSAERPLLRLAGIADPAALRGEPLLVDGELDVCEWLAADLVGCRVEGLGTVRRVLAGPSCDLLELDDGTLLPFVTDAVVSIEDGLIRVDRDFLAL